MTPPTKAPATDRISWPARILLAGYPPGWRSRYDDEQRTTVLAMQATGQWRSRDTRDLLRGLVEAWLNPGVVPMEDPMTDPTRRLIPRTAWGLLLFVLAGGGFARVIDDPIYTQVGGDHPAIGWCVDILMVVAGVTAVVMAATTLLHVKAILDLGRQQAGAILKPLIAVPVGVLLWAVTGVLAVQVAGATDLHRLSHVIAFAALAAMTVAVGVVSTAAITRVAGRVPDTPAVRASRRVAMIAVGCLTALGAAAVVGWLVLVTAQAPQLLHSDAGMLATPIMPSLVIVLLGLAAAAVLCGDSAVVSLRRRE